MATDNNQRQNLLWGCKPEPQKFPQRQGTGVSCPQGKQHPLSDDLLLGLNLAEQRLKQQKQAGKNPHTATPMAAKLRANFIDERGLKNKVSSMPVLTSDIKRIGKRLTAAEKRYDRKVPSVEEGMPPKLPEQDIRSLATSFNGHAFTEAKMMAEIMAEKMIS